MYPREKDSPLPWYTALMHHWCSTHAACKWHWFMWLCSPRTLQACADKLDRELNRFGCPPVFPTEEEEAAAAAAAPVEAAPEVGYSCSCIGYSDFEGILRVLLAPCGPCMACVGSWHVVAHVACSALQTMRVPLCNFLPQHSVGTPLHYFKYRIREVLSAVHCAVFLAMKWTIGPCHIWWTSSYCINHACCKPRHCQSQA